MSRVSIQGNDAGTGTFTIAAPNSNNNRSFSLPDEDGVVVTDSTDLEPQVKTSLNATGDAPLFACRAFCNFDGTGTVSIRASGNVSSITDLGTGKYTVNFATAMTDTNYATVFYNNAKDTADFELFNNDFTGGLGGVTTTSVNVSSFKDTFRDSRFFNVVIFR